MRVAPMWIRLYSLPCKYWDLEILQDIGNTLEELVKIVEQNKQQRHTKFSCICVYMDLSKEILEVIILNWEDEEWMQPIKYEHIPSRCRQFHDYGHFIPNFPKNGQQPLPTQQTQGNMADKEGFVQILSKRKPISGP